MVMKGIFLKGKNEKIGDFCLFVFLFSLSFWFKAKKILVFIGRGFLSPPGVLWNWVKHDRCSLYSAEYNQQINMHSSRSCLPTFPYHCVRSLRGVWEKFEVSAKHHVWPRVWKILIRFWEVYKGLILTRYFFPCKIWRIWHLFWLI